MHAASVPVDAITIASALERKKILDDVGGRAKIHQLVAHPTATSKGSVTLKREWVFDWLNQPAPVFWLTHLGLLAFFAAQFENGAPLVRGGVMEGTGDDLTLVIDRRIGLGGKFVDGESFVSWEEDLGHLALNDFFEVERRGQTLRVKREQRLRAIKRVAA